MINFHGGDYLTLIMRMCSTFVASVDYDNLSTTHLALTKQYTCITLKKKALHKYTHTHTTLCYITFSPQTVPTEGCGETLLTWQRDLSA